MLSNKVKIYQLVKRSWLWDFSTTVNNTSVRCVSFRFLSGGNRSIQRKLPTCQNSLTNFITYSFHRVHLEKDDNRTYYFTDYGHRQVLSNKHIIAATNSSSSDVTPSSNQSLSVHFIISLFVFFGRCIVWPSIFDFSLLFGIFKLV